MNLSPSLTTVPVAPIAPVGPGAPPDAAAGPDDAFGEVVAALLATLAGSGAGTAPAPADASSPTGIDAIAVAIDMADVSDAITGDGSPTPGVITPTPAPSGGSRRDAPAPPGLRAEPVAPESRSMPGGHVLVEPVDAGGSTAEAGSSPLEGTVPATSPGPAAPTQERRAAVVDAPAPVIVTMPAAPAAEPTAAAPAPVSAPASAPPPHEQVVRIVQPLRQEGDGTYHVTLQLQPEELGAVEVGVELRGTELHLVLHADDDATTEVLRLSLADLRSELEDAGFQPGRLQLGHDGGAHDPHRPGRRDLLAVTAPDAAEAGPVPSDTTPAAPGAVDLNL